MSSWNIDPKSGDYIMGSNGAPDDIDDLTIPAYYRIRIRRGAWLYAPSSNYGSTFHLQKKRRSTENASLFEAIAADALQPMVDDGRALEIAVDTQVATRNAVGLQISITNAQGEVEQAVIDPIRGA